MGRLIFSMFLLSLPVVGMAQIMADEEGCYVYPYQKRVEKYQSFWNKIIPSHTKIQYAGSYGVSFFWYGLGLWEKESAGDEYFFRIFTKIFYR
ncbi:MAG: hypothetical protein LBG19_01525 [Prevotellaceae bacterium]|nr:hypothetical protein [Prevotellaceae bacterium]